MKKINLINYMPVYRLLVDFLGYPAPAIRTEVSWTCTRLFLSICCLILSNCVCVSFRNADALSVSDCTTEKKKELFTIARQGFDGNTRSATVPVASYQLIQSYLGSLTNLQAQHTHKHTSLLHAEKLHL